MQDKNGRDGGSKVRARASVLIVGSGTDHVFSCTAQLRHRVVVVFFIASQRVGCVGFLAKARDIIQVKNDRFDSSRGVGQDSKLHAHGFHIKHVFGDTVGIQHAEDGIGVGINQREL